MLRRPLRREREDFVWDLRFELFGSRTFLIFGLDLNFQREASPFTSVLFSTLEQLYGGGQLRALL